MKLLTPMEVAQRTGLPYAKALLLVKSLNYIQIKRCYYIREDVLEAFLKTDTPIIIMEEER